MNETTNDKAFLTGMRQIEQKYLDFFIDNGRLLDHCHFFYVERIASGFFHFRTPGAIPREIQAECMELFDRLFKKYRYKELPGR